MCGIAGILRPPGARPEPALLEQMVATLAHRGPDARDVTIDGRVGLAHARLSIIDVAGGKQPMRSTETGVTVVFNGEIFNYLELRGELESRGHHFRTRSDTEVLLRAYEAYGEACVERFNGQWAFALWDPRRQRLLLSRDRMGVRPLYWTRVGEDLLFASEMKALLAHPGVVPAVDLEALDDILTFWTTLPPRTFFRGISELAPGHNLVATAAGVQEKAYWQLTFTPAATPTREDALAEELDHLLVDAVRLRLRADVPVGAYLSGGLDSSLTAALVKNHTDTPLETFSVTFADRNYDESVHQQHLVAHLGTRHAQTHCADGAVAAVFADVVRHAEQPIVRTAPAPLYLLARLVRERGYKVVLTGEGADEVFGGYDIFKEAKIRRFWGVNPESRFRPHLLRRLYPYLPALQTQPPEYLRGFFHVRKEDLQNPLFSHLPRWELTAKLKGLLADEVKTALRGRDAYDLVRSRLPAEFDAWHPFCQAQYLETTILLPGYILSSQGDRMAMAHSVEGRYPFLDHRVVAFGASLHPHLKMRVLSEKHLLKRVAASRVPASIIARTKQPYRAPDVPSFFDSATAAPRLPYIAEALSAAAVNAAGLFHPTAVAGLVDKCRRPGPHSTKDSMALVSVLSTQLVCEQLINHPSRRAHHG